LKPVSVLVKYVAAFAGGYVGALIPILASGDLPGQKALIAAVAGGLLATGLFHSPGPSSK